MKRNVLSFFKSSACAKSFFVFGAAFLAILSISCKQLASFDPVVNGEQVVVGGGGNSGGDTSSLEAAEFSFNLKATHGLMRKISLEWTAFSGAKYYEIYFAESAAAEFTKIGETEQPFFDDAVAAGRTGYFKVCAVKANGSSTPFSSTVVGTSLAVPIIGGGEVNASSASISWFMENARGIDGTDYYEKALKFEVVCQPKGESEGGENKVLSASSFSSTSYSYTFEELSSSKDYEFYVAAYLESDTQSRETSPTVDKTTLTTYTPLSPKFSASEGDSAKGISLLITLPEMVTVKTFVKESENQNIMQDVSYPLCFKVFRKHEKEKTYSEKNAVTLYYNGTNLTTSPVEYQEAGAPYEVGAQVTWFDGDASLIGGEKYDYMIRSFVDINYSKVVCVEGKEYETETGTPLDKANTSQGWKSAPPSFNVKETEDGGRKLSADNKKVVSVSFGFSAEWNDLGKASDYKFAIRQTYTPFTSESGTSAWLKNGETIYFDTLDGIKALVKTFGSDSGLPKAEQGTYSYTLYVVSKNDNGTSDIESNDNVLDSVNARDKMVVTEEVQLPKAELSVQGGYKNKVHYKFACEQGVKYQLERTKIVDGKPTDKPEYIELNNTPASGTFEGDDTTVQDNCSYSYVLKAVAASGVPALSTAQEAETLGTPKVEFKLKIVDEKEELPYDSVTVSFDGVLAAKEYVVTLGAANDFGGGISYTFVAGGDSSSGNAEVSLKGRTYSVTINKPEGYDNARLAGKSVDAVVTAKSGVDYASGGAKVNVLGPALLNAQVNAADTTGESISLTWKKVAGAKGYLIKRVMYADVAMTSVADESGVTYYCDDSGTVILPDDDEGDLSGRIKPSNDNGIFTLIDICKKTDSTTNAYEKAQAKLAWGLPFRYVVLPVLDSKDFDFDDLKLVSGKVAYKNLEPTKATATWGYGLNLVAEKAMSGKKQDAKWKKPHVDKAGETDYAATKPVVYRRVAGETGKFKMVNASDLKPNDNAASLEISGNDCYEAYEYVIKYCLADNAYPPSDIELPPSLLAEIEKNKQDYDTPTGVMTELDNKGYLLTLGGFDARVSDTTYYEQISWNMWEYDKRAVGPDSMIICVQNNNIDADFHDLVTIEKANVSNSAAIKDPSDDIKAVGVTERNTAVLVAPAGIVAGTKSTTDGYLKVLRDYKHNYTFKLQRKISTDEGDVDISISNEEYEKTDYIKTAYRQITNEELVRAATLAMAYGIMKTGTNWQTSLGGTTDTFDESSPGSGQAKAYRKGGTTTIVKLSHKFTFTNFTPAMPTLEGEKATFLTVNGTMDGYTGDGGSEGQKYAPRKYQNGSFTVTAAKNCGGLYNATITISSLEVNGTSGIKVKYPAGGEEVSFGNITPFAFGNGNGKFAANPLADGKPEWQ